MRKVLPSGGSEDPQLEAAAEEVEAVEEVEAQVPVSGTYEDMDQPLSLTALE